MVSNHNKIKIYWFLKHPDPSGHLVYFVLPEPEPERVKQVQFLRSSPEEQTSWTSPTTRWISPAAWWVVDLWGNLQALAAGSAETRSGPFCSCGPGRRSTAATRPAVHQLRVATRPLPARRRVGRHWGTRAAHVSPTASPSLAFMTNITLQSRRVSSPSACEPQCL